MGSLAATRRKHALTGLQGRGVSSIAFGPSLLDDGNWLVNSAASDTDHAQTERRHRHLKSAAAGERDPERLVDAAPMAVAA